MLFYKQKSEKMEAMNTILEQLGQIKIIPVVKIEDASQAPQLSEALMEGGLPCAEITFRTAAAEATIAAIRKNDSRVLVGAGTVLTVEQAQRAVGAGAGFIVSPGFDPVIVDWCLEREIPVLPGAVTATEIIMGLNRGLKILKFFPSEALGGVNLLKTYVDVFSEVKFIPTGGVTPANLPGYLALKNVYAVGGTWIAKSDAISGGKFDQIAQNAREACAILNEIRSKGGK